MKNNETILISFLGKKTSASNKEKGYREANYEIEGKTYSTAYFGFALAAHIKPGKIILLGTSGSMWDVLIEAHADKEQEEKRLELMDLAAKENVSETILQELTPIIEARLSCQVEMKIIPYARTTPEQIEILSSIAASVPDKAQIVMDVTHGFRHLPMLGLLAAHYLEHIKNVQVEGIYYGALEMTENGKTPVLNLSGLLQTMNWIQAISAYDASGNYTHFADVLKNEGWTENETNNLRQAAFYERTTNIVKAKEKLSSLNQALEKKEGPFLQLFSKELIHRLSWWKNDNRAEWESKLAKTYFDRGDYLRSSIFLQEACISENAYKDLQTDYEERDECRKEMIKNDKNFKLLCHIRNGMAHGIKGTAPRELKSEQTLKEKIGGMIKNWKTLGKNK